MSCCLAVEINQEVQEGERTRSKLKQETSESSTYPNQSSSEDS